MTQPSVVLVHGAFHGAWCWDRVTPLLHELGVTALAIDLPGHGASAAPITDLYGDAAAVGAVVGTFDIPPVLVGHSYGGAVITQAAIAHPVAHLVYVAAVAPEAGKNANGGTGGTIDELPDPAHPDPSELVTLDPSGAASAFYQDCSDEDVAFAVARLTAQNPASMRQPVDEATWRRVGATYVVCTQDKVLPPAIQRRLAAKIGTSRELEAGHSPFFSRPRELAAILADVAGRMAR